MAWGRTRREFSRAACCRDTCTRDHFGIPLPAREQLQAHTDAVLEMNGFRPRMEAAPALPPIRHVVVIVKESLSYDEVLAISRPPAMGGDGDRRLARLGSTVSPTASGSG